MKNLNFILVVVAVFLVSTISIANTIDGVDLKIEKINQDRLEISISDLPEAVTNTLKTDFAEFTPEKAYKSTKDDTVFYYVQIKKDDIIIEILFDDEGNALEKK